MKLNSAFGNADKLRIKTFELHGQEFRVRVPLTKEMEDIAKRCESIDPEVLNKRYEKAIAIFQKDSPGVEFTGDDVIVDGRSTKELVSTAMRLENRIVEYVKLLVPTDGGKLENLTYEEIEDEWPLAIQIDILSKISEAIQPGYKDARKNS